MGFRSIIISSSSSLSVKNNNLVIKNHDECLVPIEDISVLVIEGTSINLTNRLLSCLSQRSVLVVICDEKHLPVSTLLPLNTHYKSYKVLKMQLEQSKSFSKRIWQRIVKQKILNQNGCLDILKLNEDKFLVKLCDDIESGDKSNRESVASRYYFKKLFGNEFTRTKDTVINSALNYGYTIIRGAVARALVSYGFNTTLGVHHCNEYNSFNLADDFMECFRPMVDLWVKENVSLGSELTKDIRVKLVDLLNYGCIIDGKNYSILSAIDKSISSYVASCSKKDFKLLQLPEIKKLEYHLYE